MTAPGRRCSGAMGNASDGGRPGCGDAVRAARTAVLSARLGNRPLPVDSFCAPFTPSFVIEAIDPKIPHSARHYGRVGPDGMVPPAGGTALCGYGCLESARGWRRWAALRRYCGCAPGLLNIGSGGRAAFVVGSTLDDDDTLPVRPGKKAEFASASCPPQDCGVKLRSDAAWVDGDEFRLAKVGHAPAL